MPRFCRNLAYWILTAAILSSSVAVFAQPWPAPIRTLETRGVTIVERFDAPGDMQGFAARLGNRPMALYLTPDGEHVIVGTLMNAEGKNLTAPELDAAITQPSIEKTWPALEKSQWIPDGKDSAERVLYVFTDPNCGYCHKFYDKTRPWVEAGKVQLRHVPVAILKPSSIGKAAALMTADDPEQAMRTHEENYRSGGIEPMADVPQKLRTQLKAHKGLMAQSGIRGTPGIIYKDSEGNVQVKQGVPSGALFKTMMGPK